MLYGFDIGGQLEPGIQREWLMSNGLGGFASSTMVGCNTRRYHGLLCAATLPPVGRIMALNRIGERMILDARTDHVHELSVNQFGSEYHPRGDRYLRHWEMDDTVRWTFDVDGIVVQKELLMPWLANAVGIRYTITPSEGRQAELQLLPFVSLRDFHAMLHAGATFGVDSQGTGLSVQRDGHCLRMTCDSGEFLPESCWWYAHTYAVETERGLDDREDLLNPGRWVVQCDGPTVVTVWASLGGEAHHQWAAELMRRREAVSAACGPFAALAGGSMTLHKLARAANDFVVRRRTPDGQDGTSIIAGYPWFADWGRDTFISLPGLLLTTRRFEQARQVLSVFAQYISQGMIPNKFDDYDNHPHYNTVDASLWFIHAAFEYLHTAHDHETFDAVLRPACEAIIRGYRSGTRYNIHMDPKDGLIVQGDASTQLTWMDAKHGDVAFTPRHGKAVEINALWHHALVLMGEKDLAAEVAASFRKQFWISPFRGLADVVGVDGKQDRSIRPNQVFAASLANSPLLPEQQAAVVEVVRRELLTPYGLRTLARSDAGYKGRCAGPPAERDAAYHNGTIWAWPMGAFLEAHLRVHERSHEAVEQVRRWLTPLIRHLNQDACIGQISEIFDGDEPHQPAGCYAQAWSVAEVLRIAAEVGM
jgi:predicted glycogen debranching enzyme